MSAMDEMYLDQHEDFDVDRFSAASSLDGMRIERFGPWVHPAAGSARGRAIVARYGDVFEPCIQVVGFYGDDMAFPVAAPSDDPIVALNVAASELSRFFDETPL